PRVARGAGAPVDRGRASPRPHAARHRRHGAQDSHDGVRRPRPGRHRGRDARARRPSDRARRRDPPGAALFHDDRRHRSCPRPPRRARPRAVTGARETFASRLGGLMTIVGVSIGLGHVWRFPYMVGKFGGAAFVLFYTVVSIVIGVPALMTEFALGRHTRRGPVGAFERGGLPLGKYVGWFFFFVVTAATGYYSAVIGWVLYYTIGQIAQVAHVPFNAAAILPPDHGFSPTSFVLQMACTAFVLFTCAVVLTKGVRDGIEKVSFVNVPVMTIVTLVVMGRTLTLPGAMEGVRWYLLEFRFRDLTAN